MKFLTNLFKNSNNPKGTSDKPFFELSTKEKKKIIIKTARQANNDQKKLVAEYQKMCKQQG